MDGVSQEPADVDGLEQLQDVSFAAANKATAESFPPERRMDGEALADFLGSRRYGTIATSRPDGRPHATPTAFLVHGREVWLPATRGTARVRNVRALAYAVIVVSEGEDDRHATVVMEGAARVVLPGELSESVEAGWVEKFGSLPQWATHWIVVTPSRLFSYRAPGRLG